MDKYEIYISVDVETSGPIPGEYSLLSLGACVVGETSKTFYREIKPITDAFIPKALEVTGLSLQKLSETGAEPAAALRAFEGWLSSVSSGKRSIFVAFNATFDWMFVAYYFHRFLGHNPFGVSGLDIKAYYMGKLGTTWGETARRSLTRKSFESGESILTTPWMTPLSRQKSSEKFWRLRSPNTFRN